jgi:hypothetical protein
LLRHADARDPGDRSKVNGEAAAAGMVQASCIDEQQVGCYVERTDCRGKNRTFSSCEKPRYVCRCHVVSGHRLGDDVIGPARQVSAWDAAQMTVGGTAMIA